MIPQKNKCPKTLSFGERGFLSGAVKIGLVIVGWRG